MAKPGKTKNKNKVVSIQDVYEFIKTKEFSRDLWLDMISDLHTKPTMKRLREMVANVITGQIDTIDFSNENEKENQQKEVLEQLSFMSYTLDNVISTMMHQRLENQLPDWVKSRVEQMQDEIRSSKSTAVEGNSSSSLLEDIQTIKKQTRPEESFSEQSRVEKSPKISPTKSSNAKGIDDEDNKEVPSSPSAFSSKKSPIWDHFSQENKTDTKAKCNSCPQSISRGGVGKFATTTNLINHLRRKHPTSYQKYLSMAKRKPSPEQILTTIEQVTSRRKSAILNHFSQEKKMDIKTKSDSCLKVISRRGVGRPAKNMIQHLRIKPLKTSKKTLTNTKKAWSSQRKSAIWDHFTQENQKDTIAKCNSCQVSVSRGGVGKFATTTNMIIHLRRRHPVIHEKFLDKAKTPMLSRNSPSIEEVTTSAQAKCNSSTESVSIGGDEKHHQACKGFFEKMENQGCARTLAFTKTRKTISKLGLTHSLPLTHWRVGMESPPMPATL